MLNYWHTIFSKLNEIISNALLRWLTERMFDYFIICNTKIIYEGTKDRR